MGKPSIAWALAHGLEYFPGDATILPPAQENNQTLTTQILAPQDGDAIITLPAAVTVSVGSSNSVDHVDLLVDGEVVQTLTNAPFVFSIAKNYGDGTHTIGAHAAARDGKTSDTSIRVVFAVNQALFITAPGSNQVAQFPQTLTAESESQLDPVSFYYQSGSTIKLIGQAVVSATGTGRFQYQFVWQKAPKAGTYKLFAKTNSGTSSQKITITVQ
jgi:hypothetical protein